MTLKTRLLAVGATLTEMIGNALAETNESYVSLTPNTDRGMQNLAGLPYVDKLMWVLDTVYALVPIVAIAALGFLAVKYYLGGWDSVENEIRSKRAFFSIIIVIFALKVGSSFVRLISAW
jgi:hypothetical protein